MIAKISSTENLGGALGYNFKKVEKEEASILLAQGLYQNKEGTYTMAEVFADMQAVIPEKCRTKKDGVPLFAQSTSGRETLR